MIDFIQPYIGITLKLVTGMIGILAFLRITGKAQMAQLTPLDTVSAFVIGALATFPPHQQTNYDDKDANLL